MAVEGFYNIDLSSELVGSMRPSVWQDLDRVRMKSQELAEENVKLRVLSVNGLSKDVRLQDDPVTGLHPVTSTCQLSLHFISRVYNNC